MSWTIRSERPNPCKNCPDRYPACSDHCKKPEYRKWRAELELIRKREREYSDLWGYTAKEIRKNRRVR